MLNVPRAGVSISYVGRLWHLCRSYQGSCSSVGRNVMIWRSKEMSCRLIWVCSTALAQGLLF